MQELKELHKERQLWIGIIYWYY